MKVLVIDNYDSFVYNLVQYIGELGGTPIVYRNDQLTLQQAMELNPERIVISPGPGTCYAATGDRQQPSPARRAGVRGWRDPR